MSDVRDPATDQQLPGEGTVLIHQAVIDSLEAWGVTDPAELREIQQGLAARRELGVRKYGRALQAHNGRDALQDAWEELQDATVYVVQMELEGQQVGDIILVLVQILRRLAAMRLAREEKAGG